MRKFITARRKFEKEMKFCREKIVPEGDAEDQFINENAWNAMIEKYFEGDEEFNEIQRDQGIPTALEDEEFYRKVIRFFDAYAKETDTPLYMTLSQFFLEVKRMASQVKYCKRWKSILNSDDPDYQAEEINKKAWRKVQKYFRHDQVFKEKVSKHQNGNMNAVPDEDTVKLIDREYTADYNPDDRFRGGTGAPDVGDGDRAVRALAQSIQKGANGKRRSLFDGLTQFTEGANVRK